MDKTHILAVNRFTDIEKYSQFLFQNWTETYVQWSPLGTYLATFHRQGIVLWGGPSWNKIIRFVHPGVKLIDFSLNERYLVTWSNEPITLSPGTPFGPDDE